MADVAERPYAGHALSRVATSGKVKLPEFARRVLERHPAAIFIGLHPALPCLLAFDARHQQMLEGHGADPMAEDERRARLRRLFGTMLEIGWPCDNVRLPELARRKAGIGDKALFVGIGDAIEIWDPALAAASDDEILADLAATALERTRSSDLQ